MWGMEEWVLGTAAGRHTGSLESQDPLGGERGLSLVHALLLISSPFSP